MMKGEGDCDPPQQGGARPAGAGLPEALLDAVEAGVLLWRDRVVSANPAAARLFGHADPTALAGVRCLGALFAEDSWPTVEGLVRACLAEGRHRGECEARARRPDGTAQWLRVSVRGVDSEAGPAALLTCVDIGAQKAGEEALASEREVLRAVFDTIPHHLFVKDVHHGYLMVNRPMARDFGVEPEAFAGRSTHDLPFLSASQREAFLASDQQVMDSGRPLELPAVRMTDPAGREVVWRITKRPLRDRTGAVVGLVGESEDLTERYRAEAEVREQQRLLQSMLDQLPHPVWLKGLDGRYLVVNRAFADFRGMTPEQIVGRTLHAIRVLAEDERGALADMDRRVLETGERVETSAMAMTRVDGRQVWRSVVKVPLRDQQGQVVGIIGISEDITEQHLAAEELLSQQRLLQAVLDQVPMSVSVKDLAGRHLIVNRTLARLRGREPAELVGLRTAEMPGVDPVEIDFLERMDARVLREGEPLDVPEVRVTDGTRQNRWYHIVKVPLRNEHDAVVGIIGVAEDITERKRAELERAQMADALEQAGDAIFMTDLEGRIRYVNPAFERLTGYSQAEVIGQTPRVLKSGRHAPEFYAGIWETLRRGEVWKGRYVNRRKDGSLYHTHSTHSPIRDDTGRIVGYLSAHRDVTQQVELDAQLLRKQRMEALGTLAGGIAHDLNNLLVPVMGYADLLARRIAEGSEEQDWLQRIADASSRARDLISRILLFSRKGAGRPQPMAVQPVVQEVLSFLRATVPAKVNLREAAGEDGWIMADPAQIHQVLMNLCVNAIQAMPDGGDLTIDVETVELTREECYLGHELHGAYVRLRVADTGTGMDAETMGHIFEPFYTTKEVGQGTGLGLSTVFGIVQACGGGLRVESAPGKGSCFELYFPTTESAPEPVGRPAGSARGRGERILVVDDEPAITGLMGHALEELGYTVTALTRSREAEALILRDPDAFDVLVTDLTMPDLTGLELARTLRDRNGTVPIVLCTGFGDDVVPADAVGTLLTARLDKPFRPAELGALLRRLLEPPGAGGA